MKKYDVTVIMPGIHPEKWDKIYDDIVGSVGEYSFEFIGAGPYAPKAESILHKKENFLFLEDFGHPSRCLQHATTVANGTFMTWGSEDGVFQPDALKNCIDFMKTCDRKDGMTIRYFEQDVDPNAPIPPQELLWTAWYHRDLRLPGIPSSYKIANIAMYYLDFFREIGGLDCRFEHVNMNCNDLAFRIQANGGTIHPSPDIVIRQTNEPSTNPAQSPVEEAYHKNDYPLFQAIYSDPYGATERIYLDYNNWKLTDEVWQRRFGSRNDG